ncbi:MAG: hypothetical protein LBC12_00460 [Nitrososphaerota archaeon]|jgi:phage FluMu protein Com|nr:hypothetical protein [Nitrososphaerota archaeon]
MSQIPITFRAGIYKIDADAKQATIYLMNTSPNVNGWYPSVKALDEALPTLLNKPIGMGAGYRQGHFEDEESFNSGRFIATDNKGNYALGTAELTDPKTVLMAQKGELGPVSVVIAAHRVRCTKCNKLVASAKHKCPEGYHEIESFVFKRVDFVKDPAYPQAGILKLSATNNNTTTNKNNNQHSPPAEGVHSNTTVSLDLLASVYQCSQNNNNQNFLTGEQKVMSENSITKNDLEQLQKNLEASIKNQIDPLTTRITNMETRAAAAEAETHKTLVEKALAIRKQAGIGNSEVLDRDIFLKASKDVLNLLIVEAETKLAAADKNTKTKAGEKGPKYQGSTKEENTVGETDFLAAVKERREKLGYTATAINTTSSSAAAVAGITAMSTESKTEEGSQ